MTTREEMALAFAKTGYGQLLQAVEAREPYVGLAEEILKAEKLLIEKSVEMADLLLKELNKNDVPYPTGQVPLPTDPGEGWRFVEAPLLNTDQYWLHEKWNDYTTENCNRDFKSGEVGAYYCPIRRKINMEPPLS